MENGKLKIILSGGGTGGPIYPSVAVAEALRRELGDGVELLFVGAEGKMEMEKLPALGYRVACRWPDYSANSTSGTSPCPSR